MEYTFRKSDRLLRPADYSRAYEEGCRLNGVRLQLIYRRTGRNRDRYGISVAKRFGNAVTRNRLKRWIRESIRLFKPMSTLGVDVVIHPKVSGRFIGIESVRSDLHALFNILASKEKHCKSQGIQPSS